MELFRTFKKYDRNMNGTLDFTEYTKCISETPKLDLSKNEIITLAMVADTNGDGVIDFEEFMKHFSDVLDMIQYQKNMQSTYDEVRAAELARMRLGKGEQLDEVGNLAEQEIKKMNMGDGSGSQFMAVQSTMVGQSSMVGQSTMV